MVYLGLKLGAAGWKAQTNPLSYGSTLIHNIFHIVDCVIVDRLWNLDVETRKVFSVARSYA